MNHPCGLASGLAALVFAAGCAGAPEPPPASAPPPPPPLPPVHCVDYPSAQQDVVSCRYNSPAQINEVWARSTQIAATSAISVGATHIQWLSAETNVETARGNSPFECKRAWGTLTCDGGPYEMPIGYIAVTRFAILSAADAAARSNDPLVPAERRPLDAHRIVATTPR